MNEKKSVGRQIIEATRIVLLLTLEAISICLLITYFIPIDKDSLISYAPIYTMISTILLVSVTIWYASSTRKMADEMRKQTEDSKEMINIMSEDFEATNRPIVVLNTPIYLSKDSKLEVTLFKTEIRNVGKTVAKNVTLEKKVNIEDKIITIQDPKTIPAILPTQIITDVEKLGSRGVLEIAITYTGLRNREYFTNCSLKYSLAEGGWYQIDGDAD